MARPNGGCAMGALSGFRVIALSDRPPSETTSFLLSELGADVIRLDEPVAHASITRGEPSGDAALRQAAYNAAARGKRSLVLDLKSDAGREAFHRLAATADVMLEAFRPGVVSRLGVDYETLRRLNPRIVYCSLTGFGQTGPYAQIPAHDTEITASSGITASNVDRQGNPTVPGILLGDVGGALHAALAITAALLHRDRGGPGQYIDVSMMSTMMTFQLDAASAYLRTGMLGRPRPLDLGAFRCKDGKYLAAANTEARLWDSFMRTIGLPELLNASMADPSWPQTIDRIQERLLTKTRDEWFKLLWEAGASVAPVLELDETLRDPHTLSRDMLWTLQHPTLGEVQQVGFPIQFSETPVTFQSFAPLRGANTDEILEELGYTPEQRAHIQSTVPGP